MTKNENVQIVKDTNSRVDEFVQSFNSHIYMNTSKPIGDKKQTNWRQKHTSDMQRE